MTTPISTKEPRVFFSLWIGESLGPIEQLSLRSFVESGVSPVLFTYDEVANIPAGVQVRDASEVLDRSRIYRKTAHGTTFAGFSNLFRYHALQEFDGIWFDLDIVLFNNDFAEDEYIFGAETLGRVNGALLSYPMNSELASYLVAECERLIGTEYKWGDLGPNLISNAVDLFDLWDKARTVNHYYPLHFRESWKILDRSEFPKLVSDSTKWRTLHLWNEALSNSPHALAKRAKPPSGTFLAYLFAKFHVDTSSNELLVIDPEWARQDWRPLQTKLTALALKKIAQIPLPATAFRILNKFRFFTKRIISQHGSK